MKTTINNKDKTLIIHSECTVAELCEFIAKFDLKDYTVSFDKVIVKEKVIDYITIPIKEYWQSPFPYNPVEPYIKYGTGDNWWTAPQIYCQDNVSH
jgi:hypothetical protein